jgi:hypothetical protein
MLPRYQNLDPCVGCHRTDQSLFLAVFPARRRSLDVTTDVARREPRRSKYTQHDVSKILADADTVPPDGGNIGGKIRGSLPVVKVFVDCIIEGFQAFSQRRSAAKVTLCPLDRFSADLDHLGWLQVVEDEWQGPSQDLARFLNCQIQTLVRKDAGNGVDQCLAADSQSGVPLWTRLIRDFISDIVLIAGCWACWFDCLTLFLVCFFFSIGRFKQKLEVILGDLFHVAIVGNV